MFLALVAVLAMSSRSEVPADEWVCTNQIEVWCDEDSCAARPPEETTPLAVSAGRDGRFSVCAYTGCWEGRTAPVAASGRYLWAADDVAFSADESLTAGVTLLIVDRDGVGFVRAGGLATPLLCAPAPPDAP